jgi:hypothetical protein
MSQHVTPGDGDDPSLAALVTQWRGQDGSIQPVAVGGHGEGGAAAPLNLDPNATSGGGSNVSCLAWMCTCLQTVLCPMDTEVVGTRPPWQRFHSLANPQS